MTQPNITSNEIGTQLIYNCSQGTHHVESWPVVAESVMVQCLDNSTWGHIFTNMDCDILCFDEPPSPPTTLPPLAIPPHSDWDNVTRTVHTLITLTCPNDTVLSDLNVSVAVVSCEETGNWSALNTSLLCRRVCWSDPPSVLPPTNTSWDETVRVVGTEVKYWCPTDHFFPDLTSAITMTCDDTSLNWTLTDASMALDTPPFPEGSVYDGTPPPYWKGDILNYTCPQPLLSSSGTNHTSVLFNGTDWVMDDPEFQCFNVCSRSPPRSQGGWRVYNGRDRVGDIAFYHCSHGFPDGSTIVNSTCEESGNWTLTDIPLCQSKSR
ncbi:hypothetical protein Pmani_010994 [Petrolisthes manimaculis]|uniref:Sushi domain-containing protein n=1 Tax=Petrolisthes manimaculis TaxID=1843537 RepID=A0AAE1Q3V4_9EUCA|nr:hypothetical protein Pmani_010994 [Petrolisthes manimaculis]